jgi:hypothetical protein
MSEGFEAVVVGFLAPSPNTGMGDELAIALISKRGEAGFLEKIWQSDFYGTYFGPPEYLSVYQTEGRLRISSNRTGGGSVYRGVQSWECYEWNEFSTSVVTVKKTFGPKIYVY